MTTEYKLNQLIEYTDEDRAKGECPVPDGSDVTVWFEHGKQPCTALFPETWDWGKAATSITAYLIHSVPREPIVRWIIVDGASWPPFKRELAAQAYADDFGGRVVKMVEVME